MHHIENTADTTPSMSSSSTAVHVAVAITQSSCMVSQPIEIKADLHREDSFDQTCSSKIWEAPYDCTHHRGDTSFDQEDSDDVGQDSEDGKEEESSSGSSDPSDSEAEHKHRTSEPYHHGRPASMKRRKVSEDEDNEGGHGKEYGYGSHHHRHAMSPPRKSVQTAQPSASRSSPIKSSSQRPSSWPARKRRSILAEPSAALSVLNPHTESDNDIDTSSLSLLSATSAMVSEGTILAYDNDHDDTSTLIQPLPLLSTSSPSPPSSSISSSSSSSSTASSPTETHFSSIFDAISFHAATTETVNAGTTAAIVTKKDHKKKVIVASPSLCRHLRYCSLLLGACRKRSFEDAIELMRPLRNATNPSSAAADLHLGWFGSIKRRKIHHFPTRWTSTLSPSPYVKLMAMRDFWDVMRARLDLTWLDLWAVTDSDAKASWQTSSKRIQELENDEDQEQQHQNDMDVIVDSNGIKGTASWTIGSVTENIGHTTHTTTTTTTTKGVEDSEEQIVGWPLCRTIEAHAQHLRHRIVVQHPSTGMFLRGLWEEEERMRRQRQMIPETVHKPMRSKILNRKPIPRVQSIVMDQTATSDASWIRPKPAVATTTSVSQANKLLSSKATMETEGQSDSMLVDVDASSSLQQQQQQQQQQNQYAEQEMMLKKRHGPTAAVRSNALSEGCDLNEYRPWKDGTIEPDRGDIGQLYRMRKNMMDPWPVEASRAKDECARMLHRMREQLNVVINLQIHLRSMIKTTPSHMSFLLSIRHPGQVSVELLNALYGPQFMQTSAFRSIEQVLWGKNTSHQIEYQQHYSSSSSSSSSQEYNYHDHQLQQHQEVYGRAKDMSPGGYDAHYQQEQQDCHIDRSHHFHRSPAHAMDHDADTECEFEEEFDEHPDQEPMMLGDAVDHSFVAAATVQNHSHIEDEGRAQQQQEEEAEEDDSGIYRAMNAADMAKKEAEVEALAMVSSRRRDSGMAIDLDHDLRYLA
ncbi:hypothetical protein EDD11_007391 [Mortierella claussenii]|nr:hypothetical protein EDD11_007391 [Mortierella claussenii]